MRIAIIATACAAGATMPAAAQGQLNRYCSATMEWCTPIARGFERESGIRVVLSQQSTGEILAQLRAEARPNMATARIIDYANARFGASAERRRLLGRWDREVGALPR